MKLASFLAIFILVSGRRVHSLTLDLNITSQSGTKIIKLPITFNNTENLREYLENLADSKLDDIAQELAKRLDGGFVLQQQPKQTTAYQSFTERLVKPDEFAVNSQATLCSVKCGKGKRIYATVNCNNQNGNNEAKCDQSLVSTEEECELEACPPNDYGQWSSWTPCSITCKSNVNERSIKLRIRTCTTRTGETCASFEERLECKEVGFCAPECPLLSIEEFRKEDVGDNDAVYTGILQVEKPRVSFGNDITSKKIEIKCSSNGETCGTLETTKQEGDVPKYHVKGLRLGFNYQPIISFKSEVDVSKKTLEENEVGNLLNVFENTCVGRPFTVDFFTCKSYGKNQLWKKLTDNTIQNKDDLTLNVQVPEEGEAGKITGSWTVQQHQDANTDTEMQEQDYTRITRVGEWFTLEPVKNKKLYLTWKSNQIKFVFAKKQEIPMSLTCNGFSDCDDGCDEDICKGNHDKKSYMIISAILGYLSLGFLLYLIFTRFAPAKNAKNDTKNIEMMPTAVPKISGISKRALFAQGWSQKGHGIWDPNAPKSDQKSSKNSIFDIKKLISILRVARDGTIEQLNKNELKTLNANFKELHKIDHKTGKPSKIQLFYTLVRDFSDVRTQELVLDQAWLWETEKNGNSEAEAAKCIKENIDDITLQSWVFNRLPDERGPGYKLAQGIQSKIVIPISEQIKKLGQKFFEFEALWDWTVSVSNAFGSVISAMSFFVDMYKDLILFFVFYHISRFIMVNKFGEIGGVNLEYIAWYMLATIFISHLTILGLSYKSIQSYQRKWTRDETWMKILGVLFPVVFIACEKACAQHLLTMAKGKLKREYPSLPKDKDQGKKKISVDEGDEMYKVKGALKKVGSDDPGQGLKRNETVDELDLEKFFDLSDEIQAQQERLGQLTQLRCFINLMDLIIENLPQAVIMTALMQISIEYARARILFKDALLGFIQVDETKTELKEKDEFSFGTVRDEENRYQSGYVKILATLVIMTNFSITRIIMSIRNIKRQPLSPGILTTVGQFLATICMVIPKILLVSSTFIYAPFLFPIAYLLEYLLVIGYNVLITGSANATMPNTIATLCVPALYQPTRSSRKVQDEGKTKSNAEADQDDKKSGCCAGFKYKIQIQNTMAESDQNLEGGCCFKCASGLEQFRNFMDRYKFISHALFLYLASGILIYIPMGLILTNLPFGQIDPVEVDDVDTPEIFSLEWLRSTKNIKCLMIFAYFLGALLYPAFAAVYYRFCHPFKFYIAKTRIIEDEDSKETAESPEKVEGDVEKKMVKKKSKQTSESPQKAEEDNAKSLNNRLYKSPLNVDKSKAETTPR